MRGSLETVSSGGEPPGGATASPAAVAVSVAPPPPPPSVNRRRLRRLPRFSLQHLVFGTPRKSAAAGSRSAPHVATHGAAAERVASLESLSVPGPSTVSTADDQASQDGRWECAVCMDALPDAAFPRLTYCAHRTCAACLKQYLAIEIMESRVRISCPQCAEPIHPTDIKRIVADAALMSKYDEFMVRRALAADADARWCPAPDCGYAVIASGCASCPRLECARPGCNASFCYHCQAEWHPNQTCDAARSQRRPQQARGGRGSAGGPTRHSSTSSLSGDNIKNCPRCRIVIVKMDDGSCNHMTCGLCGAEFCWLCMQEISDLHYLSPSGCTFWGKKPWSRKKKILWQLGTLAGAPVGVALLAGIAMPAMIIGIPVWVGKKIHARYRSGSRARRNAAISSGVFVAAVTAPVLSVLAVGIGVPILLAYIYGVVPFSLCRAGGCGLSTTPQGVRFEFDDETEVAGLAAGSSGGPDAETLSQRPGTPYPSIGEVSALWSSGSQLDRPLAGAGGGEPDRQSASVAALPSDSRAGSLHSGSHCCRQETSSGQRLSFSADARSERSLEDQSLAPDARSERSLGDQSLFPDARSERSLGDQSLAADARSERSLGTISLVEDQPGASTRALAGSIFSYKMCDSVSQRSAADPAPEGRSGSPGSSFSGDEAAALSAARRHARRHTLDTQASSVGDDAASTRSVGGGGCARCGDDELSVRWVDELEPPGGDGGGGVAVRWPAARRGRRRRSGSAASAAAAAAATTAGARALPPVETGLERRLAGGGGGGARARSSDVLLVRARSATPAAAAAADGDRHRGSLPCILSAN